MSSFKSLVIRLLVNDQATELLEKISDEFNKFALASGEATLKILDEQAGDGQTLAREPWWTSSRSLHVDAARPQRTTH